MKNNLMLALLIIGINTLSPAQVNGFGISPTSGNIGASIRIDLANLPITDTSGVLICFQPFVRASITEVGNKFVTVTAPKGASIGYISIAHKGKVYFSEQKFAPTFISGNLTSNMFTDVELTNPGYNLPKGGIQYIESGDLNNDGKPDLAITSTTIKGVTLLINKLPANYTPSSIINGQAFSSSIDLVTDTTLYDIHLSDLNGDGRPEVLATSSFTNKLYVFQNKSTSSQVLFGQAVFLQANANYLSQVTTGDLNQDGKPELIVTSGQNNTITIYKNNISDSAISQTSFMDTIVIRIPSCAPGGLYGIAAADINNDQLLDIVTTSYCDGSIYFMENASQNNLLDFRTPKRLAVNKKPSHFIVEDFNNDNNLDIAICHDDSLITIIQNNHMPMAPINIGNFTTTPLVNKSSTNQTVSNYYHIKSGDMNGDGKVDLITTDWFMSTYINLNLSTQLGELAFAQRSESINIPTPQGFASTISDFNFDGRSDIIVSKAFYNANFLDGSIYCFTNMAGFPSSTEEPNQNIKSNLKIYPNPTSSNITIEGTQTVSTLSIFNLQGGFIIQVNGNSNSIDVSELKSGMYVLQINDGGIIQRKLFIKN